jgi:hypothetical protein
VAKFTPTAAASTSAERPPADWLTPLRERVEQCLQQFHQRPPTPPTASALEQRIKAALDAAGCAILRGAFQACEPGDK